jgi:hypothetical protein
MAYPTPATRYVAHVAVGAAAAAVTHKMLGKSGAVFTVASFLLVAWLHAQFDAPVAKAMADVGLQF